MQGKNIRNSLIILMLVSILAGCSSVKLGYRFMDNAIRWKINDYVALNAVQKGVVTRRVNEFHRWHQTTQLSTYAAFMERKAVQFQKPTLTVSDVSNIYDETLDLMYVSLDELVPVITDMLLSLSPEQIPEVINNLERESAKRLKKDFGIIQAQRSKKLQLRMVKRIVQWTGGLNKSQLEMIEDWAQQLPIDKDLRIKRQNEFQAMMIEQLKDRSNPEQFKRTLIAQIKTPERFSSPAYQQSYAKRKQLTLVLMADLFNSLTATQKARLINSTKKYQADFLYLAPRR